MMPITPEREKITARHLEGRAYIYVRQSTPKQVQQHHESQRNQYALVQRALALGWIPERVHVIDVDLGQSGQDRSRPCFQELVAEVSLGQVGIILAYEASRLARNNADWYRLLDLARSLAPSSPTPTASTIRASTTTGCCSACAACSARPSSTCCSCAWPPAASARSSAGAIATTCPPAWFGCPMGG
jgi:hypothetical protein